MRAATLERLRRIAARGSVWPDEREDVLAALIALGVRPDAPGAGHPLADLVRARETIAGRLSEVYLNREDCRLLAKAVRRMEREA